MCQRTDFREKKSFKWVLILTEVLFLASAEVTTTQHIPSFDREVFFPCCHDILLTIFKCPCLQRGAQKLRSGNYWVNYATSFSLKFCLLFNGRPWSLPPYSLHLNERRSCSVLMEKNCPYEYTGILMNTSTWIIFLKVWFY